MKMTEGLKLSGRLQVFLNDERVVDDNNMIVDSGKEWAARMLGGVGNPVLKMRVGDGTAAPDLLQTDIQGNLLVELDLTNPGGDVYANTIEFVATATTGMAIGAVAEVGLFTGVPTDDMIARKAFPVVNKGPTDVMSFIWTVTVV